MVELLPKEIAVSSFQQIILDMLANDNKLVRASALLTSLRFVESYGWSCFQTFLPQYKKLIEDPKWRVRAQTYECLINIGKHINVRSSDLF